MNSVDLIGNLTKDVELRYSRNETAICKFRIAVNEGFGDSQRTSYIPITVFGKQAENCDKYIGKGSKVAISGRIETDDYETESGERNYVWTVIANKVEFLTWRDDDQPSEEFRNSYNDFDDLA